MNLNNQINQKTIDRWDVLRLLHSAGHVGVGQRSIRLFLQQRNQHYAQEDLKSLLKDISDRGYCSIEPDADGLYHCRITPEGIDLHEYHTPCPNAIARPPKSVSPNA